MPNAHNLLLKVFFLFTFEKISTFALKMGSICLVVSAQAKRSMNFFIQRREKLYFGLIVDLVDKTPQIRESTIWAVQFCMVTSG